MVDRPRGATADLLTVLRECPDYRRLYFARSASLLGDWFNLLAVLALLREMGHSAAGVVGTIVILKLLPLTIAGPVAGVCADRFSRKAIMIASDLTRFAIVVSLFAAPYLGAAGVPLVFTVTFLQMTAHAFSEPARTASIPNLVPERLLGAANALGALTWSIMFTMGAALGGLATTLFGWKFALGLDASSYVFSALVLTTARIPRPRPRPAPSGLAESLGLTDIVGVVRYLRQHPKVVGLMSAKSGWAVAGAIAMILAIFGERIYPVAGSEDMGIALLYTARGLGTALGPILARRLTREEPRLIRVAITVSFVLGGVCYLGFSVVTLLPIALALVVVSHIGGSTIWVFSTVLLQRAVPDGLRGRVFAAEMGAATAIVSASTLGYAVVLDVGLLGPRSAAAVLGLSLIVAAAVWVALSRLTARASRPSER